MSSVENLQQTPISKRLSFTSLSSHFASPYSVSSIPSPSPVRVRNPSNAAATTPLQPDDSDVTAIGDSLFKEHLHRHNHKSILDLYNELLVQENKLTFSSRTKLRDLLKLGSEFQKGVRNNRSYLELLIEKRLKDEKELGALRQQIQELEEQLHQLVEQKSTQNQEEGRLHIHQNHDEDNSHACQQETSPTGSIFQDTAERGTEDASEEQRSDSKSVSGHSFLQENIEITRLNNLIQQQEAVIQSLQDELALQSEKLAARESSHETVYSPPRLASIEGQENQQTPLECIADTSEGCTTLPPQHDDNEYPEVAEISPSSLSEGKPEYSKDSPHAEPQKNLDLALLHSQLKEKDEKIATLTSTIDELRNELVALKENSDKYSIASVRGVDVIYKARVLSPEQAGDEPHVVDILEHESEHSEHCDSVTAINPYKESDNEGVESEVGSDRESDIENDRKESERGDNDEERHDSDSIHSKEYNDINNQDIEPSSEASSLEKLQTEVLLTEIHTLKEELLILRQELHKKDKQLEQFTSLHNQSSTASTPDKANLHIYSEDTLHTKVDSDDDCNISDVSETEFSKPGENSGFDSNDDEVCVTDAEEDVRVESVEEPNSQESSDANESEIDNAEVVDNVDDVDDVEEVEEVEEVDVEDVEEVEECEGDQVVEEAIIDNGESMEVEDVEEKESVLKNSLKNTNNSLFEQTLTTLTNELEELRDQIDEKANVIATLNDRLGSVNSKNEEMHERLQAEIQEREKLELKNQSLEAEVQSLQEKINDLRNELETKRPASSQEEVSQEELEYLQQSLEMWKSKYEALSNSTSRATEIYEKRIHTLESKLRDLSSK